MVVRPLALWVVLVAMPLNYAWGQELGDTGFRGALIGLIAEVGGPAARVLVDPRPVQRTLAPFPSRERIIFVESDGLIMENRQGVMDDLGLPMADAVVADTDVASGEVEVSRVALFCVCKRDGGL